MTNLKNIKLSKDNKRMIFSLVMLFLAVLVTYKIPHDSYSVAQYLIKPINVGGGVLYLSGLIPLVIGLIGIIEFVNIERFANKSKLLIFLLVVVIILPLMKWSLDFTRTNYYWIKQEKLGAVDIDKSDISLYSTNDKLTITMTLDIKDYSRSSNEFKLRVYFPEALSEYTGSKTYESKCSYVTHGYRKILTVKESMVIDVKQDDINQIFSSRWSNEDVIYELYDDNETIRIIDHGI